MLKRAISVASLLLLSTPLTSYASDQLIPAGSMISCRVAEGRISSQTTAIGDPVLCTLDPVERYGRSVLPYGSYLEGRFEDYRDPGHFVGKGWMELRFDRMFIGNRVVPIAAKVVSVPKYNVDRDGKILGNGHAVKDTVEWLIPVLWPIDLINLPRRGPRPVIKPETQLTLELMDDVGIPDREDRGDYPQQHQAALIERVPQQQQAPQQVIYQTFQSAPQQQPQQQVAYQQQAPAPIVIQQAPPQVIYQQAPQVVYQPAPVVVRPRPIYMQPPPPGYVYPYGYRYYGPGY
jgi:hypothetical protein